MTPTADGAENVLGQDGRAAARLGLVAGQTVQEVGAGADSDAVLQAAIEVVVASPMVGLDHDDVVDVVLLWFRDDGEDDLVDALVDAIGPLADSGLVWLLTPKMGRDGHVESADIADAATTAGLQATSTVSASADWQGTRLVSPRARR